MEKRNQREKTLLVEGARRIGKSTIVETFAKNEYKSYFLIDFNKATKKVRDNFENINNLDLFSCINLNRKSLFKLDYFYSSSTSFPPNRVISDIAKHNEGKIKIININNSFFIHHPPT